MRTVHAVIVAIVLGIGSAALGLEIAVTVQEPVGAARVNEPVSGGIPLPAGRFKPGHPFALFEGEKEFPLQALPLVVDEKGFLRWILLDFQADLGANEKKTFTLKDVKASAKPAKAVTVTDGADGVTIDTGAVKFTVSRAKPFALFDSVSAGGKGIVSGTEVSYVDAFDDKKYAAEKPASVVVEYRGPMRVTVCARGGFAGDEKNEFGYIARFTAWAGSSRVFVKYTLSNSVEKHYSYRQVKDSSIALKLAGNVSGTVLGASKPVSVDGGKEGWMHQGLAGAWAGGGKAGSGEKEMWVSAGKEDPSHGWLTVKTDAATTWVCDLYFLEDAARRIEVKDGSLVLTGVATPYEGVKDKRGKTRGRPFSGLYRTFFDCTHLSSHYLFDFAPGEGMADGWLAAQNELHAFASPSWYSETEGLAFGKFGTAADELACYDTWKWKYDASKQPKRAGRAGGRRIGHQDVHFDFEQDIIESLLLLYLRSGERSYYNNVKAWSNFWMDTYAWRTDGWRFKDGGVWWVKNKPGPLGNRPQRPKDPVTGVGNMLHTPKVGPDAKHMRWEMQSLAMDRCCYCHNWAAGLAGWYCLTGDRDAFEACIDLAEQHIDTERRAFEMKPGVHPKRGYSRQFNRASYLAHAVRLIAPADEFIVEASDYLAKVYLERPRPEPRGLVNCAPGPRSEKQYTKWPIKLEEWVKARAGEPGWKALQASGVKVDSNTMMFTDPKTGAVWRPIEGAQSWMNPPLSKAMDLYTRITGNEDAMDWAIAYGMACAHVLYQPRHGNLDYKYLTIDFPVKGIAKDFSSWAAPPDNKNAEGFRLNGYLARFHPDVCARGYWHSGEPLLKQRAHDFWWGGSHRGHNAKSHHHLGEVGSWVGYYGPHSEYVTFTQRTFYIHAHPRKDQKPPKTVTDLAVTVNGDKATVTFTAPADEGGGVVARYQVKCAAAPLVDYEKFLDHYAANTDAKVRNWWMASNLEGEPVPKAPGGKESFVVTGVPEGATHFAVRSFDDSRNRSAISNVAP